MTPAEVKEKRHTGKSSTERKMLSPEAMKRDVTWGKIAQKKYGHQIEIDNTEKDCILIWGIPKKLGREGEEAQVVIIERENIQKLITLLERTMK